MTARELETKAEWVRQGGELSSLKKREVIALQQYALDSKDIELYDRLEEYWRKPK